MFYDGGPAFPPTHNPRTHPAGMSLRDWFAGQAMSGLILGYQQAYGSPTSRPDEVASEAYRYADAMLAARAQTTPAETLPPPADGLPALLWFHAPGSAAESGRIASHPSPGAMTYVSAAALRRAGVDPAIIPQIAAGLR